MINGTKIKDQSADWSFILEFVFNKDIALYSYKKLIYRFRVPSIRFHAVTRHFPHTLQGIGNGPVLICG